MTIGTSRFFNRDKLIKLFLIAAGLFIFFSVSGICFGYKMYISDTIPADISLVKVLIFDIAILLFIAMSSFSGVFSFFDFPAVFTFCFLNSYLLCDYFSCSSVSTLPDAVYLFFGFLITIILSVLSSSCFLFSLRHIVHSAKYFVVNKRFTVPIVIFVAILTVSYIFCLFLF